MRRGDWRVTPGGELELRDLEQAWPLWQMSQQISMLKAKFSVARHQLKEREEALRGAYGVMSEALEDLRAGRQEDAIDLLAAATEIMAWSYWAKMMDEVPDVAH